MPGCSARGPAQPRWVGDTWIAAFYDFCLLIAQRLRNREIAEKLFLTEGSVKQYLNQIYSKLHLAGDARTKREQLIALVNTPNP